MTRHPGAVRRMTSELRRVPATWSLEDDAQRAGRGSAEAVIDDAGLSVAPVRVAFLDSDSLDIRPHEIEIALWPAGRLKLSGLGRRFETFSTALRKARNQARVAGLLAHAPSLPQTFEAEPIAAGSGSPVEVHVYPTHVTLVPAAADPWQLPLGALRHVTACEDPPAVTFVWAEDPVIVGTRPARLHACRLHGQGRIRRRPWAAAKQSHGLRVSSRPLQQPGAAGRPERGNLRVRKRHRERESGPSAAALPSGRPCFE